jgi:hypothetical protein
MSSKFQFLFEGETLANVEVDKSNISAGRIPASFKIPKDLLSNDFTLEDYLHFRVETVGNNVSMEQSKTGIKWLDER